MKIKISILFFIFSAILTNSWANQQEVDSLILASLSEKNDSILLENYNKIGSFSYKLNQQLAKKYWQKALEIGERLVKFDTSRVYKSQLATSYNGMGIISRREGKYPEALTFYQKCLKIESVINTKEVGITLMNIGVIYREMKEYDKALDYVNQALDLAIKYKNKESYSSCYNGMGMIYRRMKNYEKALECYQLSMEASIEIDDKDNIAQSYNNMGAVYYIKKDYKKALELLNKGYELHLANGNEAGIIRHHSNMVSYYIKTNKPSKALKEAHLVYDKYEEMGRRVELADIAKQMSDLYVKNKNYEKAFFTTRNMFYWRIVCLMRTLPEK